jgi:prophage maintenance system killer protein
VSILSRSADQPASGIAEVVGAYLPGLVLLHDYDEGTVATAPSAVPTWELTLAEARSVIATVAAEFPGDTLAGRERGEALEGIIASVYQGFGGQDVYPTVEEKAAHLLYFVVKDHPLADGNKRSAAALFVSFLARNNLLYDASGAARVTNNALAALTLLVASSSPREKDLMIALIVKMLETQ